MKYIKKTELGKINNRAKQYGMKSLSDNAPVLVGNCNVPVFLAIPSIDTLGWVRCEVPTTPDCETHAILDIWHEGFNKLADIPSTVTA